MKIRFKKRWLPLFCLGALAVLGLTGCGSKHIVHHKPKPLNYQTIVGGGSHGYFANVNSTQELQDKLKAHGNHPKELLITSNLNGNTNGVLQNQTKDEHTHLENELSNAKQKPKLKVNNDINENKRQKLGQAKKAQNKQWQKQKGEQKNLEKKLKQNQTQGQKNIKIQSHTTVIYVPSNTTVVANPNVNLQNIVFRTKNHSKNIIFRNINTQTADNFYQIKPNQINNLKTNFQLQNTNGVKLEHDTVTGVTKAQNRSNLKKRNHQAPKVNGAALTLQNARHILVKKSQFSSLNQVVNEQRGQTSNGLHFNTSQVQVSQSPFALNDSYNQINNIDVQYNKGLSLLYLVNPIGLTMKKITIHVQGENADNAARQLLKSARNTTPTAFINKEIEINNKGYIFLNKNGKLVIKAIASPNNKPLTNDVGAVLGSKQAREN